jgi:hypothetical protein
VFSLRPPVHRDSRTCSRAATQVVPVPAKLSLCAETTHALGRLLAGSLLMRGPKQNSATLGPDFRVVARGGARARLPLLRFTRTRSRLRVSWRRVVLQAPRGSRSDPRDRRQRTPSSRRESAISTREDSAADECVARSVVAQLTMPLAKGCRTNPAHQILFVALNQSSCQRLDGIRRGDPR